MLNHVGTQPLDTERLVLRKHAVSDAEDMFHNWVADPEVSRFLGWQPHKDINETKLLLSDWIYAYKNPNVYHWIIIHKSCLQAIGYIYLADIDDEEESASVHFALSRKYWRQGIMTEACRHIMKLAFDVIGVKRIHSCHHVNNPASGKVMIKCGMKHIKTEYRLIPNCVQISGTYDYYAITANDWLQS